MSKMISGVNAPMNGFGQMGTGRVGNVGMSTDSFASIMENTTYDGSEMGNADFEPADTRKTDVQNSANVMKENKKVAEKIEKSAQTKTEETSNETLKSAEEAVNETAEKVVEKVADTLGLSKEEVEQAMETLGLTAVNLLDSANLTKLMLNLSGETDMMALTTNENLYMGLKDIIQSIQNELTSIKEMYGLSEEQLNGCVDALSEEAMQQLVGEMEEVTDSMPEFEVKVEESEKTSQQGETVATTEMKNNSGATVEQETTMAGQNENPTENNQGELTGKNDVQNGNIFLQNLTQSQKMDAVTSNVEMPFTETQTQDIMNQIMDYMKVQVKADATNLELQLHPESLGTLNIRIAAKEGVLTAQFTTPNEAVKSVIESQLITLQQNLNEQGFKVEAVEVNVATHQFDRNLQQGQGSNEQASEEAKKKGPRRINLNDLDSLEEEELEEADRVTADMMARNGNTVDYLA